MGLALSRAQCRVVRHPQPADLQQAVRCPLDGGRERGQRQGVVQDLTDTLLAP